MRHFSEILQVIPIFCDYQLLIYFPLNSQQQISLPNKKTCWTGSSVPPQVVPVTRCVPGVPDFILIV